MMLLCQQLHNSGGCQDAQLLGHVDELLEELGDPQDDQNEGFSESDQDMQT